ncbi:GNAT family N-acetyltransferase [Paenibacillus sp. LHD-38]|uniref:GNAT family N-acetyltransferase n=1 Tax=Paenibacillus sp. LHD-38 TaxID=3072143 RepID=UPI00280F6658|nr:GNAT family N-acetyltransferase [Paenibacillus sp. LHD-38]MDQ8739334.1 GNAT family N-acetyltransferase [Paenibacillus sp. LHD-38]
MKIRRAVFDDVKGIVHVHIESIKSSHVSILPQDFLDNLTHEWSTPRFTETLRNPPKDVSLLVAEDERGKIIGFIWGGPERKGDTEYKGEIYAVYVLSEFRGVGVGRQLVSALVEDLISFNIDSMLVMVFESNLASRRFYEAMGGCEIREGFAIVNGEQYKDVVYAWNNINGVLS